MPIYEYRCKSCEKTFEKLIRWSESNFNPTCPDCQSQNTEKKVSTFASLGNSSTSNTSSSCGSSGRFG